MPKFGSKLCYAECDWRYACGKQYYSHVTGCYSPPIQHLQSPRGGVMKGKTGSEDIIGMCPHPLGRTPVMDAGHISSHTHTHTHKRNTSMHTVRDCA